MSNDFIFSWAENAEGRMVHVDSVPRGLRCGCTCLNCHEPLLARHGEKNEHGFAHHSDTRGANLNICHMVILYKLASKNEGNSLQRNKRQEDKWNSMLHHWLRVKGRALFVKEISVG